MLPCYRLTNKDLNNNFKAKYTTIYTPTTTMGVPTQFSVAMDNFFLIPFLFAVCINIQQMLYRNEERKENSCRIERCRGVLINTPLYQVSAGTFLT
jgi:hypothetical protein